jgi:putative transcriptional regulator
MKKTNIIIRMDNDGALTIVQQDGSEILTRIDSLTPRSDAAVEAAAANDPENPPLTEERRARLRPIPRAKTLRRALGLTQEEFATRYHIPLGTLRDWEQGRTQPDQPARAYLTVIAADPEGVRKALQSVQA